MEASASGSARPPADAALTESHASNVDIDLRILDHIASGDAP
jgi:hypothetical protein